MYAVRTELKMSVKFNVFLCSLSGFYFRASRWRWAATWILYSHLLIDRQIWGKLCAWRKERPWQVLLFWWKVDTDSDFLLFPASCLPCFESNPYSSYAWVSKQAFSLKAVVVKFPIAAAVCRVLTGCLCGPGAVYITRSPELFPGGREQPCERSECCKVVN